MHIYIAFLLLSALQLFVSFGLLNYFFPLFPLLRPLFPIGHPIFLKSFLTSSSHLTLGLPFSLVAYGFHLYMVLATLSLVILSTCPNQFSRLYFMYLTIFTLLIAFSRSSLACVMVTVNNLATCCRVIFFLIRYFFGKLLHLL